MEEVASFELKGNPARVLRSRKSGLSAILVHTPGPLVQGYIAIATEAKCNRGLPHTLEHLIFLGSKAYPHKGVLDLMANRCFSDGTNAWTDVDHTCYTLTTAGAAGFLALIPVYLDHILRPTLSDYGFTTEVYHRTPTGRDGGVVHCEMEARNNSVDDRIDMAVRGLLYPDSGYSKETGGICADIRRLTNADVRRYHADYYTPKNTLLIVCGAVEPSDLAAAVEAYEAKCEQRAVEARDSKETKVPVKTTGVRPWSGLVPDPVAGAIKFVEFPSVAEDIGQVVIGWAGPAFADSETCAALFILMAYLTESTVSPLHAALVETEEPLANGVWYDAHTFKRTSLMIHVSGVAVVAQGGEGGLRPVRARLFELLKENLETPGAIDMDHMGRVLRGRRRTELCNREMDPGGAISTRLIDTFLYTPRSIESPERAVAACEDLKHLDTFKTWSAEQWSALGRRWLLDAPSICVIARPSCDLAARIQKEKDSRIEKAAPATDEEASRLSSALDEATKHNARPVPSKVVQSISIPQVRSIRLHPVVCETNFSASVRAAPGTLPRLARRRLQSLPVAAMLCHVGTRLVDVTLVGDVRRAPLRLRKYAPLLCEALCKSDVVTRDGKLISHQDVVRGLDRDTQDYGSGLGLGFGQFSAGSHCDAVCVSARVEATDWPLAGVWTRRLAERVQFSASRLRTMCLQLVSEATEYADEPGDILRVVHDAATFRKDCASRQYNFALQKRFLERTAQDLADPKSAAARRVLADIESLYAAVFRHDNVVAHVAFDATKYDSPEDVLGAWRPDSGAPPVSDASEDTAPLLAAPLKRLRSIRAKRDYLKDSTDSNAAEGASARLVRVPSAESGFLVLTVPLPRGFGPGHRDYHALQVLLQLFTASEGPLFRGIRGRGLAYGYRLDLSSKQGLVTFGLSRCANICAAYREAKKIVLGFGPGSFQDQKQAAKGNGADEKASETVLDMDGAKSSLVLSGVVEPLSSPIHAAYDMISAAYFGSGPDYARQRMEGYQKVTQQELLAAARYIRPLFDASNPQRVLTAVTGPVEGAEDDGVVGDAAARRESLSGLLRGEGFSLSEHTFGAKGPEGLDSMLLVDDFENELSRATRAVARGAARTLSLASKVVAVAAFIWVTVKNLRNMSLN